MSGIGIFNYSQLVTIILLGSNKPPQREFCRAVHALLGPAMPKI
ncbi:hypothetical protein SAMN04515695_2895 [Pseudovibrio sp. Tun.PSC04-5.I4]|nr:hypothetical protein SAMN04515695_2895 [Pseudovibrio sp. Tun.PSC04-5.I4]